MVICPCILSIWWSSAVSGNVCLGLRFTICISMGRHGIRKAGELDAILEEQHS